jgi:hypothetical protein
MAAIIQLVQSGRMPRTVRASEQIETLATDAIPRAVRATEQIETLVTDAIILLRPPPRSTPLAFIAIRVCAWRLCVRHAMRLIVPSASKRIGLANRTMKLSRRGQRNRE